MPSISGASIHENNWTIFPGKKTQQLTDPSLHDIGLPDELQIRAIVVQRRFASRRRCDQLIESRPQLPHPRLNQVAVVIALLQQPVSIRFQIAASVQVDGQVHLKRLVLLGQALDAGNRVPKVVHLQQIGLLPDPGLLLVDLGDELLVRQ